MQGRNSGQAWPDHFSVDLLVKAVAFCTFFAIKRPDHLNFASYGPVMEHTDNF